MRMGHGFGEKGFLKRINQYLSRQPTAASNDCTLVIRVHLDFGVPQNRGRAARPGKVDKTGKADRTGKPHTIPQRAVGTISGQTILIALSHQITLLHLAQMKLVNHRNTRHSGTKEKNAVRRGDTL